MGQGIRCSDVQWIACTPRAVSRTQYGSERQVGRMRLDLTRELGAETGTSQPGALRGSLQCNSPLLGMSQGEYDMYGVIQFAVSLLV